MDPADTKTEKGTPTHEKHESHINVRANRRP